MRFYIIAAIIILFYVNASASETAQDLKRFYEKVVQMQPDNANAQFDLGNVYLAEKRYEDALARYDKVAAKGLAALRMDSYYFNRAVCYEGLGKMDAAVRSLEACVKVNPANREAQDLLDIYRNKQNKIVLSP